MPSQLNIPIYLDTNALLDLLATIEGGFSMIERISSQTSSSKEIERSIEANAGTEFGILNVLNLFKVSVGLAGGSKKMQGAQEQRDMERYHTYGSLFNRLRDYLEQNSVLLQPQYKADDWEQVKPSSFIEVHGLFTPSPLVSSMQTIEGLMGMMDLLSLTPNSKPTAKTSQQRKSDVDSGKDLKQIRGFLRGVVADIEKENIRMFSVDCSSTTVQSLNAVVLIFTDYLRDKSLTEITHREYSLLGKVVRKVNAEDPPIDLLRGASLRGLGEEALDQLINAFSGVPGMNLPEVKTKIPGDALEIVPIAIYV